eukprot:Phypoly_transcript_04784.p1 GENE.Phypoly_transcript_04784~~Phypoly_transcript_04784.p1  ORF type:complete len:462 (+),score=72.85 Phypoly_transcript_04784:51-1436(+)
MATEEYEEYAKGSRRYTSSSLLKGTIPARSYAPRGTYGPNPHYLNNNKRNSTSREYSQSEQRKFLDENPTERASNVSPQHQHYQSKQPLEYNDSNQGNNDTRKRKTERDGYPSPAEQRNTNGEWQEEEGNQGEGKRKNNSASAPALSTAKRSRSNSNDESGNDTTRDTRHESSKYGNGKGDYGNARDHSRSSGDSEGWDDRPHYREGSEYNGRGRHDNRQGWEGRGTFSAEAGIEAGIFCKKKLWVGGLPADITCEEIKKYFGVFGKLIYVMISPKGNAFVKFSTEAQALHAYKECYTAYIRDKLMRVKYAIRKANKMPHNKLLYINNVPSGATRTDLKSEFEKYGEIEDVQMFTVPYLYFFVTFVQEECAVKARKALKTKYFIQFGKNRTDDKKPESPETDKTQKELASVQPFDISECKVCDVLEPLSDSQTLELSDLLGGLQPTNTAIRVWERGIPTRS